VIERGGGVSLRCRLDAGRTLEVPAWMFEQEACVPLRLAPRPVTSVGALAALRGLLTEGSGRKAPHAPAPDEERDSAAPPGAHGRAACRPAGIADGGFGTQAAACPGPGCGARLSRPESGRGPLPP